MSVSNGRQAADAVALVYDALKSDLVSGQYAVGSVFQETELCARMGVSRTPVREAVRKLAQEGFVEKVARGWQVRERTPEEILALYDVLIPLESTAAALATERITEFQLAGLTRIIEERAGLESSDPATAALNRKFHELLWAAAGNEVLLDYIHQLRNLLAVYKPAFLFRTAKDTEAEEHEVVYRAIANRDVAEARDAMAEHLRQGRNSLVAAFLVDASTTYQ